MPQTADCETLHTLDEGDNSWSGINFRLSACSTELAPKSDIFKIMQCICSFTLACATLALELTQDCSFAPLMVQMNLAGSFFFFFTPSLHMDSVSPRPWLSSAVILSR